MAAGRVSPDQVAPGFSPAEIEEALDGRYELLGTVGRGACSTVLKVSDRAAEGEVKAAKLMRLPPDDPEALESVREEFRLASRFAHPNLVRYFDLDLPPGRGWALITMEMVEGMPLSAAAARWGGPAVADAVIDLLRGLQFLHESGFVHGDVKSSNVLCRRDGDSASAVLLDYHLVVRPSDQLHGGPRGTLRYMAPEVIAGQTPDARSDLYSTGVLLYEALTGSPPFDGSPQEIAAQHLTAAVGGLGTMPEDKRGAMAQVLGRLLAKSPDGRYATASEAIGAIGRATGREVVPETHRTLLGRARSAPLVGRDDVLDEFGRFLQPDQAPGRTVRAFLIRGQTGAGKSRLLRECEVRAQSLGHRTLRVQCDTDVGHTLSRLEQELGVSAEADVAAGTRDLWTQPASVAGAETGNLAPPFLSRLDRLADGLTHLADRRSILILADGVEALSAEAREALSFLMWALSGARGVRFCLSVCGPEECPEVVEQWLRPWQERGESGMVHLGELDAEARRALIRAMLPASALSAVIDSLSEGCGGRPDMLAATVEHLVSTGRISVDGGGAVTVSADLAEAGPDVFRQLTADALACAEGGERTTLELLAVAGEDVELSVLADAAGLTPGALGGSLSAAPLACVVSLRPVAAGVLCRLQHRSVASVILNGLSPSRRAAMHDLYADALERCSAERSAGAAVTTVWHRLRGAQPSRTIPFVLELLRAPGAEVVSDRWLDVIRLASDCAGEGDRAELLERQGDFCMARGDSRKASESFRASLLCSASESDRERLVPKLATAHAFAGDAREAERCLGELTELPGGPGGTVSPAAAEAWLAMSAVEMNRSRFEEACAHCERAMDIGSRLGQRGLVGRALAQLGKARLKRGAIVEAEEVLSRALEELKQVGATAVIGDVLTSTGYAAMLGGDMSRASECLEESMKLLRASGRLGDAARALNTLGGIRHKLCEWDLAARSYEEALDIYGRLGYGGGRAAALVNLSDVNGCRGRLEPALAQAEEAFREYGGDVAGRCHALLRAARVRQGIGDLSAAREAAGDVLELAISGNLEKFAEAAHRALGETELLAGRFGHAREHLTVALDVCRERKLAERETVCLIRLSEVEASAGNLDAASSLAACACARTEGSGLESIKALARAARGKVNLAQGRPEQALNDLVAAEEAFSETHVWDERADVSFHLGKAYAALGRLRFASLHFRTALDTVEEVADRMESPENRRMFLSDPRRTSLFEAIRDLRQRSVSGKVPGIERI